MSGATTSIRLTLGPIRSNPRTRQFLLDLMRETVAVGRALGVNLPEDYAEQRLAFADGLPVDMTSSMHHDLQRGRPLEVRWLSGGVVEMGAAAGVPDPRQSRCLRCVGAACRWACRDRAAEKLMTASAPVLTIRSLRATAVEVPMTYALGTSRQRITTAPLLLIDLMTEEGVTGHAYLFCYLPAAAPAIVKIVEHVESVVKGDAVAPLDLWRKVAARFALMGVQGIVRMAMAGLDVAAWDALAIGAGLPLARCWARSRGRFPPTTVAALA